MLTGKQVINVNVERIVPNRYQPRDKVDTKKLEGLAQSIKKHGMIQPIILRPVGDKYEIIVGERRYDASIIAGYREVPAIIVSMSDSDMAEITLTENMQKQELSPIEEARSYQKLQDENHLGIKEIAIQTGKDENFITNKLKLLTLSPKVQKALLSNQISEGHAKVLLKLAEAYKQDEILNKILIERLPVKATDDYINSLSNNIITPNLDTININELDNKTMQSALNDLEITTKISETFNDKDSVISEKKEEEKNMDMNALNQVAQTNNTNVPNGNNGGNNNSKFFPSFDNEPVNMNITPNVIVEPVPMDNTNYGVPEPNYQAPSMPTDNGIPNTGLNQPINNNNMYPNTNYQAGVNPAPLNEVPVQNSWNEPVAMNPNMINNNPTFGPAINPQGPIAPTNIDMNQNIGPDFRVEPATPTMPNMEENNIYNNQVQANNIPIQNNLDINVAVANINSLLNSLEAMGYHIFKEEINGQNGYQITIKIQ